MPWIGGILSLAMLCWVYISLIICGSHTRYASAPWLFFLLLHLLLNKFLSWNLCYISNLWWNTNKFKIEHWTYLDVVMLIRIVCVSIPSKDSFKSVIVWIRFGLSNLNNWRKECTRKCYVFTSKKTFDQSNLHEKWKWNACVIFQMRTTH